MPVYKNNEGSMPLHYALDDDNPPSVEMFKTLVSSKEEAEFISLEPGTDLSPLHNLLDSNLQNDEMEMFFHLCVDLSVSVELRNQNGQTPLIHAARRSSQIYRGFIQNLAKAIDVLLYRGADIHSWIKYGYSATNYICLDSALP